MAWFRSAFLNRVLTPSRQELARLQQAGCRYAVLDALTEHHLEIRGEALRTRPLVTGGSGLAIGSARQWAIPVISSVHETVQAIHRARCCALRLLLADDEPAGWLIIAG